MEETHSGSDDDFRFPWEYLIDFYAIFCRRNCQCDETVEYDCCLTRVHLNDKDLVKRSERKQAAEPVDNDDVSDAVGLMSLFESTEDSDGLTSQTSTSLSALHENNETRLELKADAWAELPKQFRPSKRSSPSKHYRKRKNPCEDAQRWLRNATFEEYWEYVACYLIYRTWFEDYGEIMSDDDRKNLEKRVENLKPPALIDQHTDEQISKYFGLTKNATFSSYEELFAVHCEKILELAEKDFEIFRCIVTNQRCKKFLNKIEKMGFVPGYDSEDVMYLKDSTQVTPQKMKNRQFGRRYPNVYGDEEIFSDVHYDVYGGAATLSVVLNDEKPAEQSVGEDCHANEGASSDVRGATTSTEVKESLSGISFAFNPIKDAYLVAKNAFEAYKDDEDIRKYWYQRYRLFSRLDKGILMDREGWFSVTPERIAEHIADRMIRRPQMLIVDAFAGVGGNTIQFALKGARVIAIDLDPVRLKCARENAKVYGVEDRIEFLCCDLFHFCAKWMKMGRTAELDAIFLSPPWGGPGYLKSKDFDLDDLTPNGFDIFTAARTLSPNIAYFLPRNAKVKQLIALSGPGGRCEIEQSCLNKKIKTLTAYYGNLAVQRED